MSGIKRRAFLIAVAIVGAGVALHVPDYVAARHQHFKMSGMMMGPEMSAGMTLIVIGLAVGAWSLLPDRDVRRRSAGQASRNSAQLLALDDAKLSLAHLTLAVVLAVGLVVDTMKPATLGFVVPPMAAEYGISLKEASLLPFVAIIGTVVGSLVWGRLADIYGRRATIMFSALMYIATCICGFMPAFGWNLLMCFLMGGAAGGMLPTVYSLASESMPARHRGWIMVLMSGVGSTVGYLMASGASTVIEPTLSWRALWLLGAPTGLILLGLSRWIPESPRFLMVAGRHEEAQQVMTRYGIVAVPPANSPSDAVGTRSPSEPYSPYRPDKLRTLFGDGYGRGSLVVVLYAVGWGIVNWGFITFLPTYLLRAGAGRSTNGLLFTAALIALPSVAIAAILYERWGSKPAMVLYAAGTGAVLAAFALTNPSHPGDRWFFIPLSAILLASSNGMLAMLSPYAAEIYPTPLRASGSGLAAAASKIGGTLGPLVLTSAPGLSELALCALLPVAAAASVLWALGPETTLKALSDTTVPARESAGR